MGIRATKTPYGPVQSAVVVRLGVPNHLDDTASVAADLCGASHGCLHSLLGLL